MNYLYLIFFLFSSLGFAQIENPYNKTEIKPVKEASVEENPQGNSPLFSMEKKTEIQPYALKYPGRTRSFSMTTDNGLLDPGERIKTPTFEEERGAPGFKSDSFLGEFRTGSKQVRIVCRDHSYEDGDRVRILVDGAVYVTEIVLTNQFKGFDIHLNEGFNKVEFEALNMGSSGPNTAEFIIYDENQKMISKNQWNLATGIKATLILVKE